MRISIVHSVAKQLSLFAELNANEVVLLFTAGSFKQIPAQKELSEMLLEEVTIQFRLNYKNIIIEMVKAVLVQICNKVRNCHCQA